MENFFPRFGFVPIARGEVPEALKQSRELLGARPAWAIVMRLGMRAD